jgi:hypothetical protein
MATVNNALVTYTNLTTMGLTAIGTPATGNRIATKAFITSNYQVDPNLLAGYVNLECPPYQYIAPSCYIVQGYVDGADLNASYNFEVCFDWYNCSGVLVSYCTVAEGGFTLFSDCYNPVYGAPIAYYYEFPGGPKVTACCSYIDGINICGSNTTTTTSTTTSPVGTDYLTAVVLGGLIYRSTNDGTTWTGLTASGSRSWNSVAMSTGGQYQLAADSAGTGTRWTSSDYGANWSQETGTPIVPPGEAGVSGTGQYQLAVPVSNQNLYIAVSNDYGGSWTNRITAGQNYWGTGAISKTGQYMIVGTNLYYSGINSVKVSSNYGVDFSTVAGAVSSQENPFSCSAVSGTGQHMLIGERGYSAKIWISSNYGTSFTFVSGGPIPVVTASFWSVAAISSTGQYMLIGEQGGYLYSSSNYGVSWTSLTSLGQRQWSAASMSTTGQYLYVCVYGGSIWFSNNYGVNWTTLSSAGANSWTGIATSK